MPLDQIEQIRADNMERYGKALAGLVEFQHRVQAEFADLTAKLDQMDTVLGSGVGVAELDQPELERFEADFADLALLSERQHRDVHAAYTFVQHAHNLWHKGDHSQLHHVLVSRYAGIDAGLAGMEAQWALALNKVRFHVLRLLPSEHLGYSPAQVEEIQRLSGYLLPADWRRATLAIRSGVSAYFRAAWGRVKESAAAAWQFVSFKNLVGLGILAAIVSAFGGVSAIAASVWAGLKSIEAIRNSVDFIKVLADGVGYVCKYISSGHVGIAFLVFFAKDVVGQLFRVLWGFEPFRNAVLALYNIVVGAPLQALLAKLASPVEAITQWLLKNYKDVTTDEATRYSKMAVAVQVGFMSMVWFATMMMGGWMGAACKMVEATVLASGVVSGIVQIAGTLMEWTASLGALSVRGVAIVVGALLNISSGAAAARAAGGAQPGPGLLLSVEELFSRKTLKLLWSSLFGMLAALWEGFTSFVGSSAQKAAEYMASRFRIVGYLVIGTEAQRTGLTARASELRSMLDAAAASGHVTRPVGFAYTSYLLRLVWGSGDAAQIAAWRGELAEVETSQARIELDEREMQELRSRLWGHVETVRNNAAGFACVALAVTCLAVSVYRLQDVPAESTVYARPVADLDSFPRVLRFDRRRGFESDDSLRALAWARAAGHGTDTDVEQRVQAAIDAARSRSLRPAEFDERMQKATREVEREQHSTVPGKVLFEEESVWREAGDVAGGNGDGNVRRRRAAVAYLKSRRAKFDLAIVHLPVGAMAALGAVGTVAQGAHVDTEGA